MRITDHALNRLSVLKAIRRGGAVARTDLPRQTGLSSGSITQLTAELLRRGLVIERKDVTRRPGRPRTFLEINVAGGIVIGASLAGAGQLNVAFVDLMGNRLLSKDVRLGVHRTLGTLAAEIGANLSAAIDTSPYAIGDISRVGIALPAIVDNGRGEVHFMTTFPVGGPVAFARPISDHLGLPVMIENDLTCMARAEHWFGRARDLQTFTLMHVGYSIGSAQYVDGLPQSGANGLNPEFGHVKSSTGDDAYSCYCGGHGCLTAYASMYGILKAAGDLEDAQFPHILDLDDHFERFLDRADAGDAAANRALERAASYLGLAIANFMNSTDPGHILLTFATARFLSAVAGPLHHAIEAHAVPAVFAHTKVELILADQDWRWKGTAALALEQTYLGS